MKRTTPNDMTLLISRVLLATLFLASGIGKLGAGYAATQDYMASGGVAGALLPLVIALEIGGATALILGYFTRWTALALAAFSVATALLFHFAPGDAGQTTNLLKNFALAGGLLLLYAGGGGGLSLDAKRTRNHYRKELA